MLKDKNYKELDKYLPAGGNEEYYALLTHFLQMENGDKKQEKKDELIKKFGFTEQSLSEAKDFFDKKNVRFKCGEQPPKFTFIDLFAGIGGFRLAMQDCGGKCVFSSEWDDAAKQTYYENYGEVPFGDITKQEIKDLIPRDFDVLCAGFPCQPFSNAGLKKGIEDTRGTLFYHIADILKTRKPKVVLLENVRGIISNDKGKTIQIVLQTITKIGYTCNISEDLINSDSIKEIQNEAAKMVLYAKDFNVPQNRPRIYIVLWRNDINLNSFSYPMPEKSCISVRNILEENVEDKFTISDKLWEGHQKRKLKNKTKGNGFGYCLFNESSPYTSTLSRRYYKDGSEILIEQKGKNPRKLTPREAANLQGFPKNFILAQSNTEAYKQFGNSIAIPVVRKISEQIVNQILER